MTKQEFIDWFFSMKPYWPTPDECYDKLIPESPTSDGQDELWDGVFSDFQRCYMNERGNFNALMTELKSKYTLIKKQ